LDRVVVNGHADSYKSNMNQISQNNREINQKDSDYKNNINGARNDVSRANSNEETAKANYTSAYANASNLAQKLDNLTNNPIPDSDSRVKPFFTANNKALDHQEARVGEKAPMTKERNTAQTIVDDINHRFNTDRNNLESKIQNSSDSTHSKAMQMIKDTRNSLS
jgi:hypothetical protein